MENLYNRRKVLKIFVPSFLVCIIVTGVYFAQAKYGRAKADIVTTNMTALCKKQMELPLDSLSISAYLDQKYSIPLPGYDPAKPNDLPAPQGQGKIELDLDTYQKSWTDNTEFEYYKQIAPRVLSEIETIYGESFKKNKFYVVYDTNFENSPLNQTGAINAGAMARPDINMIFLGGSASLPTFIHETIHLFNGGVTMIDAYEEGLTESVTRIVIKKIDPNYSLWDLPETENRYILSSLMGFFRTIDNVQLTNDRYDSAAKFFQEAFERDKYFYSTYRDKLKNDPNFSRQLSNPAQFVSTTVLNSLCAELMSKPQENEIKPFVAKRTEQLMNSLTESQKVEATKYNYAYNSVININPESKLYIDMPDPGTNGNDHIDILSTFKRSSVLDIFYALYAQSNKTDQDKTNYVNLPKVIDFGKSLITSSASSLQDMALLIEEPADKVSLQVSTESKELGDKPDNSKGVVTQSGGAGSGDRGLFMKPTITELKYLAGVPQNYTGNLYLNVWAEKKVFRAYAKKSCAGIDIEIWNPKACWPDGIRAEPQMLKAKRRIKITFSNGKIENSLAARWWFSEESGDSISDSARDNSGNANGTQIVDGKIGKARYFNGANDSISVPNSDSLNITDALTLDMWVKPEDTPSSYAAQFVQKAASVNDSNFNFYYFGKESGANDGKVAFYANINGQWTLATPLASIPVGRWSHVAATYDSQSGKGILYINGQEIGRQEGLSGKLSVSNAPVLIGRGFGGYYKGIIDEVEIYSRALSAEEIKAKMPVYSSPLKADIKVLSSASEGVLGSPIRIQAKATNLGSTTWLKGGDNPFHLRSHGYSADGNDIGLFDLYTQGVELPNDIPSGESATMNLEIPTGSDRQINQAGSYQIGLDMVQEGWAWFGNEVKSTIKLNPASTTSLQAKIEILSVDSSVSLSSPIKIKAKATNLGSTTWLKGGNNPFHLRSHGYMPDGNYINDLNTTGVELSNDIYSGESVTMDLEIQTGPNQQINQIGSYQIGLDMVQEGWAWFGNEVKSTVKVN